MYLPFEENTVDSTSDLDIQCSQERINLGSAGQE